MTATQPRCSASLPTLRMFYRLFDAAPDRHAAVQRLPLSWAVECGWRNYSGMRDFYAADDLVSFILLRYAQIAAAWTVVAVIVSLLAMFGPVMLAALVLSAVWFRYGLWHLVWTTVYAASYFGLLMLELSGVLARPESEGRPELDSLWLTRGREWTAGYSISRVFVLAAWLAVLPLVWIATLSLVSAAMVGVVEPRIGASALVGVVGAMCEPRRTVYRCAVGSFVLLSGVALKHWPEMPVGDVSHAKQS